MVAPAVEAPSPSGPARAAHGDSPHPRTASDAARGLRHADREPRGTSRCASWTSFARPTSSSARTRDAPASSSTATASRRRLLSYHRHNEAARTAQVVGRLAAGERLALVSDAGLPGVNDPGRALIAAAVAAGVGVTVLPGPSAVETALVAERARRRSLPVRRLPPAAPGRAARARRRSSLGGRERSSRSSLRAGCRRRSTCSRRSSRGVRAAVCRELTKRFEEVARGRSTELAARFAEPPRGEITLVLGPLEVAPAASADEAAREAVAELVAAGASRRTASDVVARLTGSSRNALYRGSL